MNLIEFHIVTQKRHQVLTHPICPAFQMIQKNTAQFSGFL